MKLKLAPLAALGLTAVLVSACDDGGKTGSMPPASTVQMLDTAQVLTLARQTSETAAPFKVDAGALVLTDSSDTSTPINVNVM